MEPGRAEGFKPRAGNLRSLPSGGGVDSFGKKHFKLRYKRAHREGLKCSAQYPMYVCNYLQRSFLP